MQGVRVLGVPVGSDDFVRGFLMDAVRGLAPARERGVRVPALGAPGATPLERLHHLDDPQTAHLLLAYCAHPRFAHLLRGVRPDLLVGSDAMGHFHRALMECFSGPDAGVARGPSFRERAEALVSLPRRFGGGGSSTRTRA